MRKSYGSIAFRFIGNIHITVMRMLYYIYYMLYTCSTTHWTLCLFPFSHGNGKHSNLLASQWSAWIWMDCSELTFCLYCSLRPIRCRNGRANSVESGIFSCDCVLLASFTLFFHTQCIIKVSSRPTIVRRKQFHLSKICWKHNTLIMHSSCGAPLFSVFTENSFRYK